MRIEFSNNTNNYALAFQCGEEKGFDFFFRELFPQLCFLQTAYWIIEVMQKILFRLHSSKPGRSIRYCIMQKVFALIYIKLYGNDCLSFIQQKNRASKVHKEIKYLTTPNSEDNYESDIIRAEFYAELYLGINSLPKECRKVFIMLYVQGKTVKEVSKDESLHLSKKERKTIVDCLKKIQEEIEQNIDKHSKTLIVSNIELLLNYCQRFYDRQFITRSIANKDILTRFENLLNDYFRADKGIDLGLPTVAYCADELHLSPNYFGDLIKKETGSTALDYIQSRLIDEAKTKIFDASKTINDVATELGFKYQQHFTRLFKQKVGVTPNEFRNLN